MATKDFSSLLSQYMRRIRASASGVACEIGLSRESVNNWKNGTSLPSQKHRDRLARCAKYLRLSEEETNELFHAANFSSEYLLTQSLPEKLCNQYINNLLERLRNSVPYPITMLLTQASWGEPPFREALLTHANQYYGPTQVMHIQPPFSLSTDPAEYFNQIGQQCGFSNIDSDFAFEYELEKKVKASSTLFIIVSRFEQGVDLWREQLAGILRSLSEMYAGKLHILFCGGQRLADLKYQSGDLSLLNIATSEYWTELTPAEVQLLAKNRYPRLSLSLNSAAEILNVSGGHPGLINESLKIASQHNELTFSRYEERLSQSDLLWQAFSPLMAKPGFRERLTTMLTKSELAPYRPYLIDPLLSSLFWRNLIVAKKTKQHKFLCWRCPAIQRAGIQMLAQWEKETQ